MFNHDLDNLKNSDKEIFEAVELEVRRQHEHVELIASENYASPAVMEAQGSQLTNKYAEGYHGKRYYGGCEFVDIAERLAIERACELFKVDYANVQPHSGSQANAAVYNAVLKPGDTVLGMDLSAGGHLTHGSKVNFSGKIYNSIQYGLNSEGDIDYTQVAELAKEHKPKMIIAGFSAFSGVINWEKFREIADSVDAVLMADIAHVAGLVAAGVYPSPFPFVDVATTTTHKTLRGPRGGLILCNNNPDLAKKFNSAIFPGIQGGPLMHVIAAKAVAFKEALKPSFVDYQKQVLKNAKALEKALKERNINIISGGTDNHLLLLDITSTEFSGKEAEAALGRANITVNKNSIPNDPRSPFVTSGLRIGSPAITTRGFKEAECELVGNLLADVVFNCGNEEIEKEVAAKILNLCNKFPVYK
ncbi:serine hydroxymethyltransferase [Francisella adeliensis]|uniref:Serine hydroxymethyltransferase n=1 Tax=Francisella adeliensis TaxID=2007306 RepID=A0A2Z4XYV1_9GAMM|nr:serine hydroxymethyltransferase [Francisella adeliensis]AXA34041.1 serine hydroxymethyltransferase [Francisella adeliensis]MBK2085202.1 serine hydroxymethyltransferase [Francisella adeliensis]MBK2096030.1 serine hydroxymethyltransferase [Francisella adeliensis]QIW12279.1 serine hydroxymethyltransferase [Francisella adeliensis]QIW14154.1 serine hydroxymethyltransferase [Francisella adeliensis]